MADLGHAVAGAADEGEVPCLSWEHECRSAGLRSWRSRLRVPRHCRKVHQVFTPSVDANTRGRWEWPARRGSIVPSASPRRPRLERCRSSTSLRVRPSLILALVGPRGRVIATDIQQGMLDLMAERIARGRLTNVTLVLGEPANPRLVRESIDLALMVDVYHELSDPQRVLRHIRDALKPRGRLVLIEYKGEDPTIPILPSHKMTVAQAKLEVEHEGFVLATIDSSLPRQHVLIFEKR